MIYPNIYEYTVLNFLKGFAHIIIFWEKILRLYCTNVAEIVMMEKIFDQVIRMRIISLIDIALYV